MLWDAVLEVMGSHPIPSIFIHIYFLLRFSLTTHHALPAAPAMPAMPPRPPPRSA